MRIFLASLLLLTAPFVAFAQDQDQAEQEIIQVENEFAAATAPVGITKGFAQYASPQGVILVPEPKNARELFAEGLKKDSSDQPTNLRWWPYVVGASSDGKMGYDLGTWHKDGTQEAGYFFTIWRKQDNGKWLWDLDTGAGRVAPEALPPHDQVVIMPRTVANLNTGSLGAAEGASYAAEMMMTMQGWSVDSDYAPYISPDTIFATEGFAPSLNGLDEDHRKARQGVLLRYNSMFSADSGDMVFIYGPVTKKNKPYGYGLQVWILTSDGWKLKLDLLRPNEAQK